MPTTIGKRIIVIPARMKSRRFPGKPLAKLTEEYTLLNWVYTRAKQTDADHVIVATPDREIASHCRDRGMLWRPTNSEHSTGTHRCSEVLRQLRGNVPVAAVVNWQVDEPLIPVECVNRLLQDGHSIRTLVGPFEVGLANDRNAVKVAVSSRADRCMWFSRAPMTGAMFHCGVYAFDPGTLLMLEMLESTELSRAENLEQLAWIENDHLIHPVRMNVVPVSINTPEDLERAKEVLK